MKIGGFQKLTLIDYPGKIASTIFTIGCNFRCPFCYNSELVKETAKEIPVESILSYLKQKKQFLDAVVICGGEPTIQQDLPEFCKKLKKLGFLVKIDTNGSNPEMLKKLISKNLVDYIAMDIKTALTEKYKVVGNASDPGKIKKSINIIKNLKNYEFRITCVPGLVTEKDLFNIAAFAKENKANRLLYLQQFQPKNTLNKEFEKIKPYSEQQFLKFKEKLVPFFNKVKIRI